MKYIIYSIYVHIWKVVNSLLILIKQLIINDDLHSVFDALAWLTRYNKPIDKLGFPGI